MNLFELAELQVLREGKEPSEALIIAYAVKIRQWLDKHREATARRILEGDKVYHYKNTIKTYAKVC